jgi:hypothetical protein
VTTTTTTTTTVTTTTTTSPTVSAPTTSTFSREERLHSRQDAYCQEEGRPTSLLLLFLDRLIALIAVFYFIYRHVCVAYGWGSSPNYWPSEIFWPTHASLSTAVTPAVVIILHLITVLEYDKCIAYS